MRAFPYIILFGTNRERARLPTRGRLSCLATELKRILDLHELIVEVIAVSRDIPARRLHAPAVPGRVVGERVPIRGGAAAVLAQKLVRLVVGPGDPVVGQFHNRRPVARRIVSIDERGERRPGMVALPDRAGPAGRVVDSRRPRSVRQPIDRAAASGVMAQRGRFAVRVLDPVQATGGTDDIQFHKKLRWPSQRRSLLVRDSTPSSHLSGNGSHLKLSLQIPQNASVLHDVSTCAQDLTTTLAQRPRYCTNAPSSSFSGIFLCRRSNRKERLSRQECSVQFGQERDGKRFPLSLRTDCVGQQPDFF